MANTSKNVLELIRWGRGMQGAVAAVDVEQPSCDDASVDLGACHVFGRPDFPVHIKGGRSLVHLRIQSVGASGRLEFDGVTVESQQVVTVGDLFAGSLVFVPDELGTGWFEFEVYDGACYSGSTARMTMQAVRGAVPPDVMQMPSLLDADRLDGSSEADGDRQLESMMDNTDQPADPASTGPASPSRRSVGWLRTGHIRPARVNSRGSKIGRADSRRWARRGKTQSRLGSMRRHKGPGRNV